MNNDIKILQVKHISNLYDWYYFYDKNTGKENDASILVVGDSGENLCLSLSKRVKYIDQYLMTEEWLKDYEYIKLPENIGVYCHEAFKKKHNTNDIDTINSIINKKYDYILFTGVGHAIADAISDKLKDIVEYFDKNFLKENGEILLAFDNNRSIDSIIGEKLDDDCLSFQSKDIDELGQISGNAKVDVYYPMPEYRFPIRIYSENYLPSLEDEDKKIRNLVKLDMYHEYAKSYIVVYKKDSNMQINDDDFEKKKLIYVKYNIDRVKKYAIRTSIVEDKSGDKYVIKKAIYKEANDHVENMSGRLDLVENKLINMVKPIKVVKAKDTKDDRAYIVFPFIEGETLTDIILRDIKSGKDVYDTINFYLDLVVGKHSGIIKTYNLDSTFNNCLMKDKKIYVIDGEWIDDNSTEVDFLRYRILKYFYQSVRQDIDVADINEFIKIFNISVDDVARYEEAENNFQRLVHENINVLDTKKYLEARPSISEIYLLKSESDRIKDRLSRITGDTDTFDLQSKKQNEVLRLTNVHVTNLENIIKAKDTNITELNKVVEYYRSKESIVWKVLRKIKNITIKRLKMENPLVKVLKYIYRTVRHPLKMLKTYFTRNGRNRIVGDFLIGDAYFDSGKVNFPKCEKPLVSIIIPCYNQISYTYKCLKSIMEYTDKDETPYEVILADDNSTDTTKNIIKFVDNIIVSRNDENLGFLKNCNKAAKLAKGDYIYFLNNDTEVTKDYLSSLVSLISKDEKIGMVGSKLVYPDGTLQEAGGIIYNDGDGANYGRNDDPDDYKYNYVKDVDYISGASIMIRRILWNEIGGFDERYTPAYCEDSDLAFEIRKRGYRVVYQPKSKIIHYEGKSCGADINDTNSIKSYQIENNVKLKLKWENELMYQSPKSDIYHARERSQDKKTVLFVDHYVPTWDKDAGSKTTYSYIKMLINRGFQVKFIGDNYMLNSPYGEILEQMGVEVFYGPQIQASIWDYFKENRKNIDIVYLNRPHIAANYIDFIRANTNAKIIFYGHDLHYLRLQREYDISGDSESLNESKYYRALEYSLMYKADMTYYPSNIEIEEIKKADDKLRCKAIQAYIYDDVPEGKIDFTKKKNILFVGGFAHAPNVDAIKWFDNMIYPRIASRRNDIKLIVVGSNATPEIQEICNKDYIEYKGYVSDEELDKLYEETRIVVAPLRYGAGIKGKIIEAMSKGAAIITTECGAEGIENAKNFMHIADSAVEFANSIVKLYDEIDILQKLSLNARKIINQNFTEESAYSIIEDDFR